MIVLWPCLDGDLSSINTLYAAQNDVAARFIIWLYGACLPNTPACIAARHTAEIGLYNPNKAHGTVVRGVDAGRQ